MCHFEVPLIRQPEFFKMNQDQSISVVASTANGIYFNHNTRDQIDLDDLYQIKDIKAIIHDHEEGFFYVLANKFEDTLGMFMIRFNELDTNDFLFFVKWKTKLDIADASLYIVRDDEKHYKELVVCYKTIFINTFNV